MSAVKNIKILDLVGPLCISANDGQRVHDAIAAEMGKEISVVLSFDGVTTLISAFLNAAIGQLYNEFSEDIIRNRLTVENMNSDDLQLLKRVVDNAKIYFANRQQFDEAWKVEVDDEE